MDSIEATTPVEDRFQNILDCNTEPDILSCSQLHIVQIVNLVVLSNTIALFGVMANIINSIIFFKQGFTNTVNISFFSMAISDLCCLVTLLWMCMCLNPFINAAGVPWIAVDFMYLSAAWPHVACGRITSYITVFITAERCISIITPLKVKQIITPSRATVVICLIFIMNILLLVPEYATSYLQFKYFPERNATLIAITFTSDRGETSEFVYLMSSITSILSFVGVILWTIILVVKLQQSSQWRQTARNGQEGTMSSRDKKTVKMVIIIASVLIVCYTPNTVVGMATFVEPRLNIGKRYMNLGMSLGSVASVFQSVNSSVTIFLYYSMSSNYRRTFDKLFGRTIQVKFS